ncbi:MAG: hypothetical protein JXA52_07505 [Planctomycetes bacterium]|nr:hypothetical protein [Planctomycetota bacterium]
MAIDAVASSTENLFVNSTTEKAKVNNQAEVSQDEFLQLLVAQMTHQDPLEPMDNAEFMSQLAQLQALDEQIQTNETLSAMHLESQLGSASSLLGTLVTGMNDNNAQVEGIAARISVDNGVAYIVLDNMQKLALSEVTQVDVIMEPPDDGTNEAAEILNVDGEYATYTIGDGAVQLVGFEEEYIYDDDGNVKDVIYHNKADVIDRDSTDYGGGFLTIKNNNSTEMDQLLIRNTDDIMVQDDYVVYQGKVIGKINSNARGANGDNLTINFLTTDADDKAVASLIHAIYYNNTSADPNTSPREISFVLGDGELESDPATVSVNMEMEVASNE